MSWILEGQRVKAKYLGVTVEGLVVYSRVKYGGEVQHTLQLDEELVLPWRTVKAGDTVFVNRSEIVE